MPDFSIRSAKTEMMDDFTLSREVIFPIMDELEVINKLLGGYHVFFNAFKKLHLKDGNSLSDWGCGGGDSLRVIAGWAGKTGIKLELTGIDATASAIEYAKRKAMNYPQITFAEGDVFSQRLRPDEFDIVISSLFTHHFPDESWIKLIQKMVSCAKQAVIINDLHRHWFAYYAIGVLTRLFSGSAMVKHDSQLSVLRGFTRKELCGLLEKADVKKYSIKWMWAFRWQVIIYKQ